MHADKLILMIASVELVGFTSDELILMITWPKIGRKKKSNPQKQYIHDFNLKGRVHKGYLDPNKNSSKSK